MPILLRLRDYGHTKEELVKFLDHVRDLVDPALPGFVAREGERSFKKPIGAFDFVRVLQRWESDEAEAKNYPPALPWVVIVQELPSANLPKPYLCVCKRCIQDRLKAMWQIRCSELVAERQILPESQKALRRAFGLLPNQCLDKSFFYDKYDVLSGPK